jgi:hypothetical protein
MVFGGLGRLRMTNFDSCDFATMTSFSLTAVCMRRTLEDSLKRGQKLVASKKLFCIVLQCGTIIIKNKNWNTQCTAGSTFCFVVGAVVLIKP